MSVFSQLAQQQPESRSTLTEFLSQSDFHDKSFFVEDFDSLSASVATENIEFETVKSRPVSVCSSIRPAQRSISVHSIAPSTVVSWRDHLSRTKAPATKSASSIPQLSISSSIASTEDYSVLDIPISGVTLLHADGVELAGLPPVELTCVFSFLNCKAKFEQRNKNEWKTHCLSHFYPHSPSNTATCSSCGKKWKTKDAVRTWHKMLEHKACHFEESFLPPDSPPDLPDDELYSYLWRKRIISDHFFQSLVNESGWRSKDGDEGRIIIHERSRRHGVSQLLDGPEPSNQPLDIQFHLASMSLVDEQRLGWYLIQIKTLPVVLTSLKKWMIAVMRVMTTCFPRMILNQLRN
jgi:hypothetical protein